MCSSARRRLIAEFNGTAKASHVKDKIVEMNHLNETLYCGCLACASEGHQETSRTYLVDTLLANVHKQNVTRFPYEIVTSGPGYCRRPDGHPALRKRIFNHRRQGNGWRSILRTDPKIPTEDRMRILRLIENLTLGTAAVGYLTESMHGAGSPQAQRIMIGRKTDMASKKKLAERLCGILPEQDEGEGTAGETLAVIKTEG